MAWRYRLLRAFMAVGLVATGLTSFTAWQGRSDVPLEEVGPVTLLVGGLLPLAWRAPYRRWRWWDVPLVTLSLGLVALGAFSFRPEESVEPAFQAFFAVYVVLATAYGYFCTATPADSARRRGVIAPVKRLSHWGLPGLDLGLVLAPLLFPFFWLRYEAKRSVGDEGAKGSP